jgi:hypothetical protein
MPTLFCVRPATRNIGNDVINKATADLLYAVFERDAGLVNIPALQGPQFGGFTAKQVFDMNRLADGVVVGGGNLFENGQITIEPSALAALRVPMMLIGLSHGRVFACDGALAERTDSMTPESIRLLCSCSCVTMVRDRATQSILLGLGVKDVELGGCPTLFMPANPPDWVSNGRILISVRHPGRMSVPPAIEWRVVEDLRRTIAALKAAFGEQVFLVCHDYADIGFAAGFPEAPLIYFDDVERYVEALRRCRLNVSYRLHAFLPCLAFGTPTIHLSYDERGKDMVATTGMGVWDIDIHREPDVTAAIMDRVQNLDRFLKLRDEECQTFAPCKNEPSIASLSSPPMSRPTGQERLHDASNRS